MKIGRPYILKRSGNWDEVIDRKSEKVIAYLEPYMYSWRILGRQETYSTRTGAADAAWREYAKRRSE